MIRQATITRLSLSLSLFLNSFGCGNWLPALCALHNPSTLSVFFLFLLIFLFTFFQLPLTARIMEWLQLQPISRQESGFVEENPDEVVDEVMDDVRRRFYDGPARRSLPTSVRSRNQRSGGTSFGRRWKFLSRKSSWRSL